jgi:hypothetical protein
MIPFPSPEPNPEFEAWRDTLPATHWARYDLSACSLAWAAATAAAMAARDAELAVLRKVLEAACDLYAKSEEYDLDDGLSRAVTQNHWDHLLAAIQAVDELKEGK